jgi:homoserine O-acetyltransferase/O-succinyltransferase
MSVVRIDVEAPETRAKAIRREADEPRSPVARFDTSKPLRLDAGVDLSPSRRSIRTASS